MGKQNNLRQNSEHIGHFKRVTTEQLGKCAVYIVQEGKTVE